MIKTIRNNSNTVVGILINGKRFSLPREVCHALSCEELNEKKRLEKVGESTEVAKRKLLTNSYFGESGGLRIQINFNEDKTINTEMGRVEFVNEMKLLHEKERALCLRTINNLLEAINDATTSHNNDLKSIMKDVTSKMAS